MRIVRLATLAYLVQSVAAAVYAFQRDLRAEPFGIGLPLGMTFEFLIGWGTAISPGLPLYLILVAALGATWRRSTARIATDALGVLGAFMFLGHLVERVVWTGFAGDALVAAFALGGALLGLAMAVAALRPAFGVADGSFVTLFGRRVPRKDTR